MNFFPFPHWSWSGLIFKWFFPQLWIRFLWMPLNLKHVGEEFFVKAVIFKNFKNFILKIFFFVLLFYSAFNFNALNLYWSFFNNMRKFLFLFLICGNITLLTLGLGLYLIIFEEWSARLIMLLFISLKLFIYDDFKLIIVITWNWT